MKSGHVDGVKRDTRICVYILVLNVHLFTSFRNSVFSSDAPHTILASTRIWLLPFGESSTYDIFLNLIYEAPAQ